MPFGLETGAQQRGSKGNDICPRAALRALRLARLQIRQSASLADSISKQPPPRKIAKPIVLEVKEYFYRLGHNSVA
jgi:hypothetical protein